MRVLLIEDEIRLAESLAHLLTKNGYIVDVSNDGEEGLLLAETNNYDIFIFDRMLPNRDGISILKEIRKSGINTPTIFLTAKDSVANRVEGLDAGADDYLIKPFSMEELLARIRALGRRSETIKFQDKVSLGNLSLDTEACIAYVKEKKIKLSKTETQLLELLIRNAGQVLSKEQILDRIWGYASDVEIKNVDLYTFYLRKKIDFEEANCDIVTIRSVGYSLQERSAHD